jgi:hypothetical protein
MGSKNAQINTIHKNRLENTKHLKQWYKLSAGLVSS